jgi:hypothetical protein
MDLQGDVGQMEVHFVLFRDSVNLHIRLVHDFVPNLLAWKSFWAHPIGLLGDVGQVEARFSLLGDSVNLSTR